MLKAKRSTSAVHGLGRILLGNEEEIKETVQWLLKKRNFTKGGLVLSVSELFDHLRRNLSKI